MTASPRARRHVTWLDLLAVAAVTVAVFAPVIRGEFSPLDDYLMIASNRTMLQPSWDGLVSFWSGPSFHIYMPLAQTIWMLVALASYQPALDPTVHVLVPMGFKIASVVTHAAGGAAAAWTLSRLTRTRWPAVVGGLVFALHPMQVESVAWTTGLKDELCGLFSILAVGCYATHARRDRPTPWGDAFWWLALLAALLAMASKPTAMVLPVLLLAVDLVLRRCDLVRRVTSLTLFLVPAIGCALIIFNAQAGSPIQNVPLPLRPLVAMDSYAFYLTKIVWPAHLTVDYGRQPTRVLQTGAIWFTWLLPAAACLALAVGRSRWWLLAAVFVVVPVLPVSGLTSFDMQQFSTVTDHYAYLPMLGVGLAATLLVTRWPGAAGGGAVAVLIVLAVLTFRDASTWQIAEVHYQRILAANPRTWMARNALAVLAAARGDLFTATRLNNETAQYNPADPSLLDSRSYVALLSGDYQGAKDYGLRAIKSSMQPKTETGKRMTLLGRLLNDRDLAETGLRFWLQADPGNPRVIGMLAAVQEAKREAAATQASTAPATVPQSR